MDIAYTYSCKWRFDFNADKSEFLIFGRDNCPERELRLGPNAVKVRHHAKHMGVILTDSKRSTTEYIMDKVQTAKRDIAAVYGLGNHNVPIPVPISP